MVDRARAQVLDWEAGPTTTTFRGRHRAFHTLPAPGTHPRTLRLDSAKRTLKIVVEVMSDGPHDLAWCLPLAQCDVEVASCGAIARFPEAILRIRGDGLQPSVEHGWLSPSYGVRIQSPVVRLRGRSEPGEHRTVIVLEIETQPS